MVRLRSARIGYDADGTAPAKVAINLVAQLEADPGQVVKRLVCLSRISLQVPQNLLRERSDDLSLPGVDHAGFQNSKCGRMTMCGTMDP